MDINAELYRLWEERDHLKIQISLLGDAERPDRPALKAAQDRLKILNGRITQAQRGGMTEGPASG